MKRFLYSTLLIASVAICSQAQYVDRTKVTEAVPATATLQSAATANGDGTTFDVSGYSSITLVITGTFSATVNFEATADDTNWTALQVVQVGTSTISTTSTSTGTFSAAIGSLKSVRARISGYASGSVTVTARANLSRGQNPQVVAGTITATQGTGTNLHMVIDSGAVNATLQAGSAIVGKVGIDQTTPGTTNKVTVGSDVVHTIVDSGAVTATVSDGSGALNVIVDSGTTAVTQATASNLNAQVVGAAASGATKAGNPVQTGGVFNTTQPTVTNGQVVENQSTARGAQIVATGADTFNVTVNTSLPAGSAVIGHVINDSGSTTAVTQATASSLNSDANLKTVGGNTVLTGNGVTGNGSQRVTIASDNTAISVNNTQQGTASQNVAQINGVTPLMGNGTTGTGSQRVTIASDNTANSNPWLAQPVPGTTNGASTCVVQSAASTNATNCKNAAGLIYGLEVINTTSTIYYLRLYNLSTSPTCSSATGFIRTVPIPHGSGAGAGIANFYTVGETFGTGIGFCLTGGGNSTDNTNAATGVYVTLHYK